MEVHYYREANSSYLALPVTVCPEEDYQLPMLMQNRIPGLLPVQLQITDGKQELYYEVTAFEPLTNVYEAKKITCGEIQQLLLALNRMMEEIERYLLRGKGVILEPELIFSGKEERALGFCYDPDGRTPVAEGLNRMARFILDHIDYEEKMSVQLAYALFQESMKENVAVRDFIRTAVENAMQEAELTQLMETTAENEIQAEQEMEREGETEEFIKDDWNGQGNHENDLKHKREKDRKNEYRKDRKKEYRKNRSSQKKNVKKKKRHLAAAILLGMINAVLVSCITWAMWYARAYLIPAEYLIAVGIAGAFAAAAVVALAAAHG